MMRLLMITNLFPTRARPHGAPFITARLREMRNQGAEVECIALRPVRVGLLGWVTRITGKPGSPPLPGYRDVVVRMRTHEYLRSWRGAYPKRGIVRAAKAIARIVDVSGFDVIYAHGMYMVPAGAVAAELGSKSGVPFLIASHGGDINYLMPKRKVQYTKVMSRADATLFVSEALRTRVLRLGAIDKSRAHVIQNGYDARVFGTRTRLEARFDLGIARDVQVVAYVGNLEHVKGADRLPAIVRNLLKIYPHLQLHVVGSGSLEHPLRAEMHSPGVKFHGACALSKVASVMTAADVVVLPSRSEGWPTIINESKACGTPVVGAAVGGVPEALDSNYLVRESSHFCDDFAARVAWCLDNPPDVEELKADARAFTWEQLVARELSIASRIRGDS